MAGRFSITAAFGATTGNLPRVFGQIESGAARMSRRFSTAFSGLQGGLAKAATVSDRFTAKLADVGKSAAMLGGAALAGGFAVAVQRGAAFEQGIADLAAVSGAAGKELDALKKRAIELGSTTKFSGVEVTGAMNDMAKAGFATKDVLSGVSGLLSAAAADGGDLGEISAGLMGTLKGMGAGTDQLQSFADMMARAGDSTSASIGSIAESMVKFGPVARQLNVSAASSFAQLSLLQDAGMDASSAGTQLAAVYSKLVAPVGATKKELAALGVQVKDSAGNMRAPEELFASILKSTEGIQGNAGKMAAFTNLVGLESKTAMLNIAAAAKSGKLGTLTKDLESAAGYADRIAAKRMDTLFGDWKLLGGAVDSVVNSLYDLQGGAMRGIVQQASAWLRTNKDLIVTRLDQVIGSVTAAAREAIPVIKEFGGGLVQGARDVLPVFRAIGGAVTTVGSFIGGLFGDDKASSARNFGRAVVLIGTAIVGVSAATRVATGVQVAYRAALVGVKGAAWLLKGAYSAVTGSLGSFTRASRTSTGAVTKGMGGIGAATSKMGKFQEAAGAATLALGAWSLAWEANEQLASESGGLGIGGILKGMWDQGEWDPAKVVDRHQNSIAKAEAKKREQAKKAADVGGLSALNAMIGDTQKKIMELSTLATSPGAVASADMASSVAALHSQLEHAAASLPKFALDPKLAAGAEAASEKLDKLTASLAQIEAVLPAGMRTSETGPIATPTGGGGRAGSPTTAPAITPQLVVPREQTAEQATVIAAAVERAIKRGMEQASLNVNVNGSTSGNSGGAPKRPRAGVNVTDSGDM